ncbi:MAG: RNA-binding S4 domain-containing protein [Deltaproteobacteria bacterium]|nr:MAG: RNA-binding S4 domain-containing protein [Deltaproteobacteria bacterium]
MAQDDDRDPTGDRGAGSGVRIDKWLWAVRCFKTRSQATAACQGGHCKVDGKTAKPSQKVRPGARVTVQTPGGLRVLEVVALAERRGSAAVAATLFIDHTPPPPERSADDRAVDAVIARRPRGSGRPTKRDRRALARLRRGHRDGG